MAVAQDVLGECGEERFLLVTHSPSLHHSSIPIPCNPLHIPKTPAAPAAPANDLDTTHMAKMGSESR